jgi:ADP-heptose:LPS heptosyltransferase
VTTLVVLRALGLGDLLTGIPALRALARAFPDHHRVLLAPAPLAGLALASGAVHEVADTRGVGRLGPLPAGVVAGADVAVNLHGRGPQSHRALLRGAPGRLLAFHSATAWPDPRAARWRPGEREPARWVRMLAAYGIAGDPDDLDIAVPDGAPPAVARGATVVHPGAASGSRRWPLDRWAAVVRHETARGRRVVLTGGPDERSLTGELCRSTGLPPDHDLAGRTTVGDLAAVVAAATRVVSGDTGVAHLATALRTPSVVLFGPTPPQEWGPPPDRAIHRVLWSGHTGDPHGARVDVGLLALTADAVIEALDGLPVPTG